MTVYYLPILFSCQGTDVREGRTECQTPRSVSSGTSPILLKRFRLTRDCCFGYLRLERTARLHRLPGPRILRPGHYFVNAAGTLQNLLDILLISRATAVSLRPRSWYRVDHAQPTEHLFYFTDLVHNSLCRRSLATFEKIAFPLGDP